MAKISEILSFRSKRLTLTGILLAFRSKWYRIMAQTIRPADQKVIATFGVILGPILPFFLSCDVLRLPVSSSARYVFGGALFLNRGHWMLRILGLMVIVFLAVGTRNLLAGTTRVYVMNGVVSGPGLQRIADRLRNRGAIVEVGSFLQESSFAKDACDHRDSHIVVIGHSAGALAAASLANDAHSCGARNVTMVGIDPPPFGAKVTGVRATNFVGSFNGTIGGARNIPAPGFGHMAILENASIQARVLSAAR
jgi:hypothetical protein